MRDAEKSQIKEAQSKARRAPAVIALKIQFFCGLAVAMLAKLLVTFSSLQLNLLSMVLLQACLAAGLAFVRKMDHWWIAIEFFFPLSLLVVVGLQIPPIFFLLAFLFTLVLYWGAFHTQVPYFPSGQEVWGEVLSLVPPDHTSRLVDVGSGLGGLLFYLEKQRPDCELVGVELAPLPWLISWLRGKLRRSKVQFLLTNYERLDFSQFDFVFAYLAPPAMPMLWNKARQQMRSGSWLLSYEFVIPDAPPKMQKLIKSRQVMLYGWQI